MMDDEVEDFDLGPYMDRDADVDAEVKWDKMVRATMDQFNLTQSQAARRLYSKRNLIKNSRISRM